MQKFKVKENEDNVPEQNIFLPEKYLSQNAQTKPQIKKLLDKCEQIGYANSRNGILHNGCVTFVYPHGGCRFYFYGRHGHGKIF